MATDAYLQPTPAAQLWGPTCRALDVETKPITQRNLRPPLAAVGLAPCATPPETWMAHATLWGRQQPGAAVNSVWVYGRHRALDGELTGGLMGGNLHSHLEQVWEGMVVGHRVWYDAAVLAVADPRLAPAIDKAFQAGRVYCTHLAGLAALQGGQVALAQALAGYGVGPLAGPSSLLGLARAHAPALLAGCTAAKGPTRLGWGALAGLPPQLWPASARAYLALDVCLVVAIAAKVGAVQVPYSVWEAHLARCAGREGAGAANRLRLGMAQGTPETALVLVKPCIPGPQQPLVLAQACKAAQVDFVHGRTLLLTPAQVAAMWPHVVAKVPGFAAAMAAGPVLAAVVRGPAANRRLRAVAGATDPRLAAPGTIRAQWGAKAPGVPVYQNAVHVSEDEAAAAREIALVLG